MSSSPLPLAWTHQTGGGFVLGAGLALPFILTGRLTPARRTRKLRASFRDDAQGGRDDAAHTCSLPRPPRVRPALIERLPQLRRELLHTA